MASVSQKLEEKLVCSICLELFRVAVTLPCGHNFCQQCIGDHWDKQEQEATRAKKGYTCPECRKSFERRPELKKNVTLCSVVELARTDEVQAAGAERPKAAQGGQCPRHGRPLELYCEDERRCICCVCTVRQCQHHRRVLFEEERSKKQGKQLKQDEIQQSASLLSDAGHRVSPPQATSFCTRFLSEPREADLGARRAASLSSAGCLCRPLQDLLRESLEKAQQETERIEQAMQELEKQTLSIQESSERLKLMVLNKFSHLEKALEDCQRQTVARIEQEQATALCQVEENWNCLKDYLDTLSHQREKAQDLLACPDDRTFLEEFPLIPSPESLEALPPVEFNVGMVEPLSEILTDISRLLLEDLPCSVAPKAADPVSPDQRNLTFDAETANKYLRLSSRNQRAKHPRSAGSPQQDHAARFELWQVLCAQSYGPGRHYWEVKVSSHSVVVGVTYRDIPRKWQPGCRFNIGLDNRSWGLQVREDCYLAWHKGRSEKIPQRLYQYLGVSLDYDSGVLSFYGLGDRTQLIHAFHHIFTEPLYPIFWLCEGRTITLCQRD
ncbi:E3 ubiquitin-protein ligase TRIM65 isoform X2 [Rhea pennata]|uniref:E3 ubiquitin-protein ligase TRIM65 isoform X2 n=1 Tax=Rhea pennata TaxID=8795 RepID=UPI002E259141